MQPSIFAAFAAVMRAIVADSGSESDTDEPQVEASSAVLEEAEGETVVQEGQDADHSAAGGDSGVALSAGPSTGSSTNQDLGLYYRSVER